MPTLAVGGCSYSDYTMVDKVYGEYCAEDIGYNYLHLARGGSSNHRTFYVATKAIEEQRLVRGDVIVLQYTDPHRKIFPTFPQKKLGPVTNTYGPGNPEKHKTAYGDAWSTDFKMHSHDWQYHERTKNAHLAFEEACFNNEFDTDYLLTQHIMFEALCKQKGIHLVILECRFTIYTDYKGYVRPITDIAGHLRNRYSPEVGSRVFCERDFIKSGSEENPSPYDIGWFDNVHHDADGNKTVTRLYDGSHLNDIGHKTIGLNLSKHLRAHKVVENT